MIERVFKHDPESDYPWSAYNEAEKYVLSLGYSVGAMESGQPTAIFKGECEVSKWRNLDDSERDSCDGTITPINGRRFRESDVIVRIKSSPHVCEHHPLTGDTEKRCFVCQRLMP